MRSVRRLLAPPLWLCSLSLRPGRSRSPPRPSRARPANPPPWPAWRPNRPRKSWRASAGTKPSRAPPTRQPHGAGRIRRSRPSGSPTPRRCRRTAAPPPGRRSSSRSPTAACAASRGPARRTASSTRRRPPSSIPSAAPGTPFGGRIRFDRLSGRWFITMATDALPGRIVIASSSGSTITAVDRLELLVLRRQLRRQRLRHRRAVARRGRVGALHRREPVLHRWHLVPRQLRLGRAQDVGARRRHGRRDRVPRSDRRRRRRGAVRAAGRQQRRCGGDDRVFPRGRQYGARQPRCCDASARPAARRRSPGNINIAVAPTALPIPVRHRGNTGRRERLSVGERRSPRGGLHARRARVGGAHDRRQRSRRRRPA